MGGLVYLLLWPIMLRLLLVSSEVIQSNFFVSDNYIELLRLEQHLVSCSAPVAIETPQLLLRFSCVSQKSKEIKTKWQFTQITFIGSDMLESLLVPYLYWTKQILSLRSHHMVHHCYMTMLLVILVADNASEMQTRDRHRWLFWRYFCRPTGQSMCQVSTLSVVEPWCMFSFDKPETVGWCCLLAASSDVPCCVARSLFACVLSASQTL